LESSDARRARDFKVLNAFPADELWDLPTQKRLTSDDVIRAEQTFVGGWSADRGCSLAQLGDAPLVITTRRARTNAGICEFFGVHIERLGWRIQAKCSTERKTWNANIKMTLAGQELVWTSEKGTAKYFRCQLITSSVRSRY
jgi:hypothetical protein